MRRGIDIGGMVGEQSEGRGRERRERDKKRGGDGKERCIYLRDGEIREKNEEKKEM